MRSTYVASSLSWKKRRLNGQIEATHDQIQYWEGELERHEFTLADLRNHECPQIKDYAIETMGRCHEELAKLRKWRDEKVEQRQQLEPGWKPAEKHKMVHLEGEEGGRKEEIGEKLQETGESHQIEKGHESGVSER